MPELNEAQRKWIEEVLGVAVGGGAMSLGGQQAAAPGSGPKIPSPAEVAQRREGKRAEKSSGDDSNDMPATQFGPSKSAVQEDDSRLSPDVEYEKLPEDLKSKLNQQFWGGLGSQQRWTLSETFRRMNAYGLWKEVKRILGEKDQPEPHTAFGGFEFQVAGNSGGILYEANSGKGLVGKLKGTGHFGEDGSIIGALHKGQQSIREWSTGSMSLHISVGPGNQFDAHIDKVSPTKKPDGGKTRIDPVKGKEHQTTEVLPEKIRDVTGIPGVILEGSIDENKEGWHGGELKVGVKVELHGPVEKKKVDLARMKPKSSSPVPKEIMEKIENRVERTKSDFSVPIGFNPDEVPTRKAVASELAAEIMEAARNGKTSIQLNLPQYLDKKDDQPAALETMREIGQIARHELGAKAEGVQRLTVTFGSKKQGGTVSIAD